MTNLEKLKTAIDENSYPYFTDTYLQERLDDIGVVEGVTFETIAKDLCLIKTGIEEIKLGDITIPSPRKYFLALANKYRTNQTRVVARADEY